MYLSLCTLNTNILSLYLNKIFHFYINYTLQLFLFFLVAFIFSSFLLIIHIYICIVILPIFMDFVHSIHIFRLFILLILFHTSYIHTAILSSYILLYFIVLITSLYIIHSFLKHTFFKNNSIFFYFAVHLNWESWLFLIYHYSNISFHLASILHFHIKNKICTS